AGEDAARGEVEFGQLVGDAEPKHHPRAWAADVAHADLDLERELVHLGDLHAHHRMPPDGVVPPWPCRFCPALVMSRVSVLPAGCAAISLVRLPWLVTGWPSTDLITS